MPKKKAAGKKSKSASKKKKLAKSKSKEEIKTEAPVAPVNALPNATNSIYCET